jgi:hypothetical protein
MIRSPVLKATVPSHDTCTATLDLVGSASFAQAQAVLVGLLFKFKFKCNTVTPDKNLAGRTCTPPPCVFRLLLLICWYYAVMQMMLKSGLVSVPGLI